MIRKLNNDGFRSRNLCFFSFSLEIKTFIKLNKKIIEWFLSMLWSGHLIVSLCFSIVCLEISFWRKQKVISYRGKPRLVSLYKALNPTLTYIVISLIRGNSDTVAKVVWDPLLPQLHCCEEDTPLLVLSTTNKWSEWFLPVKEVTHLLIRFSNTNFFLWKDKKYC